MSIARPRASTAAYGLSLLGRTRTSVAGMPPALISDGVYENRPSEPGWKAKE